MSEAVRRMGPDEFLEWCTFQEGRHELIDGVPVAMAGAKQVHDLIAVNAILTLGGQLRGGPCRTTTGDVAIRIPNGNIRRPDVGVDCGRFDAESLSASDPRLVIEVLSPSTRTFDALGKLREYQRVPSLRHIILIDPETPQVLHWRRDNGGQDNGGQDGARWTDHAAEGLDAAIELPDLNVTLRLADLYEGLAFRPRPRSVAEPGV